VDASVDEPRFGDYTPAGDSPKSWFGNDEPMRGDLHHLFAFEAGWNIFPGNTAYAEFGDWPAPAIPDQPAGVLAVVRRPVRETGGTHAFEPAGGKAPDTRPPTRPAQQPCQH
jgi:hypothetical protein